VTRKQVQDGHRWRGVGIQCDGVAVDDDPNSSIALRLQGLKSAHNLALQPILSGVDWRGCLASAPSAPASVLDFSGLVRTGEPFPPVEPFARLPTVRKPGNAKPLPELGFG
jgi:hypothetical protein